MKSFKEWYETSYKGIYDEGLTRNPELMEGYQRYLQNAHREARKTQQDYTVEAMQAQYFIDATKPESETEH